jgi:hypothetical protein
MSKEILQTNYFLLLCFNENWLVQVFSGVSSELNWTCEDQNHHYIWSTYPGKRIIIHTQDQRRLRRKRCTMAKTYKNVKKGKTYEYPSRYFDTHAWLMTLNQKSSQRFGLASKVLTTQRVNESSYTFKVPRIINLFGSFNNI